MTSGVSPVKHAYRILDDRLGLGREREMLSVSIYRGVVPRSELTDKETRADDVSNYKVVEPGDVVINRMSAYQGALGIARQPGIVSPEYIVLRPQAEVEARFLTYLFKSAWFVSEMSQRVRGIGSTESGANVRTPRINPEDLGSIPVLIPPRAEQRAIADYLDTETARIDAIVTKKRRMIELLRQREVAVLETLLLLGDFAEGAARFEGDWEQLLPQGCGFSPVKHLADCVNSGAWGDEPGVHEMDLPVATTAQIDSDGQFHIDDMAVRSFEPLDVERYRCRPGDIVIVKSSGSATNIVSGKAGLVSEDEDDFIFSNFLMRLRPNLRRVDPRFLYLLLVSHLTRQRIERMVSATTYPNLQVGDYLAARLPVPPFAGAIPTACGVREPGGWTSVASGTDGSVNRRPS